MTGRGGQKVLLVAYLAFSLSGCGENGISFMFPFGKAAAHQREWFF